jgi:uncharacterized protein YacL
MIRKIYSLIIVFVFALTGLIITDYYWPYISEYLGYDFQGQGLFGIALANIVSGTIGIIVFGGLGAMIAPAITNYILSISERLAIALSRIPTSDVLVMIFGVGLGLIIANLIGSPFAHLPYIGPYVPIIFSLLLSVVGAKVALRKHTDIVDFFVRMRGGTATPVPATEAPKIPDLEKDIQAGPLGDRLYSNNKLLDTSVIIDGRVMDIMAAGFLDGKVVVPNFVLEELQKLSDSSDNIKRAKGRRGLDLVQDLQHSYGKQVLIIDYDFEDYFYDVVGVSVPDLPIERVELMVKKRRYPYIKTKPLHCTQKHIKEKDTEDYACAYKKVNPAYVFDLESELKDPLQSENTENQKHEITEKTEEKDGE